MGLVLFLSIDRSTNQLLRLFQVENPNNTEGQEGDGHADLNLKTRVQCA